MISSFFFLLPFKKVETFFFQKTHFRVENTQTNNMGWFDEAIEFVPGVTLVKGVAAGDVRKKIPHSFFTVEPLRFHFKADLNLNLKT